MPNAPTTRLGLVLPSGSDSPPDVAGDFADVFDDLDAIAAIDDQGVWPPPTATPARRGMYYWATDRKLLYRCDGTEWRQVGESPPTVTSLPTGADSWEGQEVLLRPDGSQQIYWHLRRIGDWWVPVGEQVALSGNDPASRTAIPGDGQWSDFGGGTSGQVVVPLAGIYTVRFGAQGFGPLADNNAYLAVGASLAPVSSERILSQLGGYFIPGSGETRTSSLAAGTPLRVIGQLTIGSTTIRVVGRWLSVTPFRFPVAS